jgi:hypothetical protein
VSGRSERQHRSRWPSQHSRERKGQQSAGPAEVSLGVRVCAE